VLIGQLLLDFAHLARLPGDNSRSAKIFRQTVQSGVRAMPVTAWSVFLIGVVLSYLSAFATQAVGRRRCSLSIFSALASSAKLGAGAGGRCWWRGGSGSAITAANSAWMRVTEEIDALATMGVSRSLRLIFPKVVRTGCGNALLVLWLFDCHDRQHGLQRRFRLDISYALLSRYPAQKVVPISNLWIGPRERFSLSVSWVALVALSLRLARAAQYGKPVVQTPRLRW